MIRKICYLALPLGLLLALPHQSTSGPRENQENADDRPEARLFIEEQYR